MTKKELIKCLGLKPKIVHYLESYPRVPALPIITCKEYDCMKCPFRAPTESIHLCPAMDRYVSGGVFFRLKHTSNKYTGRLTSKLLHQVTLRKRAWENLNQSIELWHANQINKLPDEFDEYDAHVVKVLQQFNKTFMYGWY